MEVNLHKLSNTATDSACQQHSMAQDGKYSRRAAKTNSLLTKIPMLGQTLQVSACLKQTAQCMQSTQWKDHTCAQLLRDSWHGGVIKVLLDVCGVAQAREAIS